MVWPALVLASYYFLTAFLLVRTYDIFAILGTYLLHIK